MPTDHATNARLWRVFGRWQLIIGTMVLLVGVTLVWASRSMYCWTWAQLKWQLPDQRFRIVSASYDTAEGRALRERYPGTSSLALQRYVLNESNQLAFTVISFGYIHPYPERPGGSSEWDQARSFIYDYFLKMRHLGLLLIALGSIAPVLAIVELVSLGLFRKKSKPTSDHTLAKD